MQRQTPKSCPRLISPTFSVKMDVLNGPCPELNHILRKFCENGHVVGMAMLRKDYDPWTNRKLHSLFAVMSIYFVMVVNTLIQTQDADIVDRAFCCATYGYMLQSVLKIYVFLGSRHKLVQLSQLFHEIIAQEKSAHLDRYLRSSLLAYKVIKGLYYACFLIIFTVPYTVGVLIDERILPFPLYLPWLDTDKSPGYELTYLFIIFLLFLYTNGVLASEAIFLIYVLLAMGHLHRIMAMVRDLDGKLKEGAPEAEVRKLIAKIVQEHQVHRRSFKLFDEVFSNHSLVMVLSASVMIVVCLLLLLQEFWLLGLVLIALGILQILFICVTGSIFEATCNHLEATVNQIDWYLMTPKLRRDWLLVVHLAQEPVLFTLGDVQASNLNTFLAVMRSLYSILMVLLGMAE